MDLKKQISELNKIAQVLIDNYGFEEIIIQRNQIDEDIYEEWTNVIFELFECCKIIEKTKKDFCDAIDKTAEFERLFKCITLIKDMIGNINGYKIWIDKDVAFVFWGYYYGFKGIKNKECFSYFRMKIERFFARKIIEILLKPTIMLEEDNGDRLLSRKVRRNLRRIKTNKKIQECQVLEKIQDAAEDREDDACKVLLERTIDFTTFVVKGNVANCAKNHSVEPIHAIINILSPAGTIYEEKIIAGFCKDCNVYFIHENDYLYLREQGVLLCQMVSLLDYHKVGHHVFDKMELKAESLLHQCGYNVNSEENLTNIQRQEILKRVIDNNLYSINGIINFLDWLIKRNGKSKNNMGRAIEKWEADRKFVSEYKYQSQREVKVEKIIKRY